ncbi:MAG: TraR/DksA family transcriptional regulator [bacterium]|nr:TraR/DksA family transcriptional regulator [bacterium]
MTDKKPRLYKPEDAPHFKQLLIERRTKILKDLGFIEETAIKNSLQDYTGDQSTYSFHMADQGTDAQEREKAIMFAGREGKYLTQIDSALKRIEDGTYGVCSTTGQPIEYARLEAIPTTTKCAAAKLSENERL